MQRSFLFLACWLAGEVCFAQSPGPHGQYPFVYYSPKDGLVNSHVRKSFQDSKGRMYFLTNNGLSVYDGTRFINYGEEEGLANEVVNDIAEIGTDTLLVATNTSRLNTLVRGKIGDYQTADGFCPVINRFLKSKDGYWYATADAGLFKLVKNKFVRLPFNDGNNLPVPNSDRIIEWKNYLLITPWSAGQPEKLILYNRQEQKITDVYTRHPVFSVEQNKNGEIWISTSEGMHQLDTMSLQQGRLRIHPLPAMYTGLAGLKNTYIYFDNTSANWLYSNDKIIYISANGIQHSIATEQGLKTSSLSDIFTDREGNTWMSSDGNGITKMTGKNIQLLTGFTPGQGFSISGIYQHKDTTWLFDALSNSVYRRSASELRAFPTAIKMKAANIYVEGKMLYLSDNKNIFLINDKNNSASYKNPEFVHGGNMPSFEMGNGIMDQHGALIQYICKTIDQFVLSVVYKNKLVMEYPIDYLGDQLAIDEKGWLYAVTRSNHVLVFSLHPDTPLQYLQLEHDYNNEIGNISPRSLTRDKKGNIWVGTRYKGLYCFSLDKSQQLRQTQHFTTQNGLTDNFIYRLYCDSNNNIWVGTQSGLDRIYLKNEGYIIENTTRNKDIFQTVYKIISVAANEIWTLGADGSILKISTDPAPALTVAPVLLLTSLVVNDEEQADSVHDFSSQQNNLSFRVAAPSFINERSIRYSYLLKGSNKKNWSEPSADSRFNFINLAPGNYELLVKADFPSDMYPSPLLSYSFTIRAPWWQTWWFRILAALGLLALIYYIVRLYYLRIMAKKQAQFEQQQALEKERSRIATDMHDDLGAGLSKIRFLSESVQRGITGQSHQPHLQNIVSSSVELVDKFNEIIWAMNEKNNSLEDLLYYIRGYTAKYGEENNLLYTIQIPASIPQLTISGETRRHIFLTVKECLHNIVKHAGASSISLAIELDDHIGIIIRDNGKGFTYDEVKQQGNGLRNMEQRVKAINGNLFFENKTGTLVQITIPFPS